MITFNNDNLLENDTTFSNLSVLDLIEARDLFHVHLMNKKNVVATAIGKYRIRKADPRPEDPKFKTITSKKNRGTRTLANSEVRNYSWPCVLVFVKEWLEYNYFSKGEYQDFIPKNIYMPDGRVVPICVVQATKNESTNEYADPSSIIFPTNFVGGGFPLLIESQGVQRVASIGCVVSDGNKYYALTNKHVVGAPGTVIYTRLKGVLTPIGKSSGKQIGNLDFETVYPGWKSKGLFINNDIGLIEIDDIRIWKTDVYGIGTYNKLADLNTYNLSLKLIGSPVCAFGSVSGNLKGEICAMFYRYKSVGGYEYAADFLIGPRESEELPTKHGDSGTLWLLEAMNSESKETTLMPLAVHWGQHSFVEDSTNSKSTYALATCLSNALRMLEVDLVRDWNLDQDYSWGKLGHFSIANIATQYVARPKLKQFVNNNIQVITFGYDNLTISKIDKGLGQLKKDHQFVPLADVPDLVWKSRVAGIKRGKESPNHFADMDKPDSKGKTLLDRCTGTYKDMKFLSPEEWLSYYNDDAVKDKSKGILPFRIWQIYDDMVEFASKGKEVEFMTALGILAHYVGDSCQPLHISYMFDGKPKSNGKKEGEGVHSVFETAMINKFIGDILTETDKIVRNKSLGPLTHVKNGKEAAGLIVSLMKTVFILVKPDTLVDICEKNKKQGKAKQAELIWAKVGKVTMGKIFAQGAHCLASIWESAWINGDGDAKIKDLEQVDLQQTVETYISQDFLPSVNIKEIKTYLRQ